MSTIIDDKTKIPLFTMVTGMAVVVSISIWIGDTRSMAHNAQSVNEKQDKKLEELSDIKTDIAVIKKILEDIRRHK